MAPDAAAELLPVDDMLETIAQMEVAMKRASKALEFERARRVLGFYTLPV